MSGLEEHCRRLERMYHGAPINEQIFRPAIRVSEGRAEVTVTVRPELHHAAHAVHGSVYFKSLDDAAFFAVNSVVPDVFVLTVSFNVLLLRPIAEGVMTSEGRLVHQSRTLFVAESTLVNSEGKQLGRGSGTFVRSTIPLDEKVGYR